MATVNDIENLFSKIAPYELRFDWDNDGLQICKDGNKSVKKCLICLDVTDDAIDEAVKIGVDMIITHHPLIFHPLASLNENEYISRIALRLVSLGISQLSAHTRLDMAKGGVNDALAEKLEMTDVCEFGYDKIGRFGSVKTMKSDDFVKFVKEKLNVPNIKFVIGSDTVSKVALVSGAGKEYAAEAKNIGADAFVTGDISYSMFVDMKRMGLTSIDAGHFYSEFPICEKIKKWVNEAFPEIETYVYKDSVIEEL